MEQKFEEKEVNMTKDENNILKTSSRQLLGTASESLLANLPILILGMVIFLAIAREFIT